jgi:predicted nuclease of predicted toxin-antitoxin system
MRVKIDENLPGSIADVLAAMGHEADTVPQEGLLGQDDEAVWNAAQRSSRFLITQDLDFSDVRKFRPGSHHGVLLLRLRKPGRKGFLNRVRSIFGTEQVETWAGCFVVATETKVPVRRPGR